jgi:hypothetical protein
LASRASSGNISREACTVSGVTGATLVEMSRPSRVLKGNSTGLSYPTGVFVDTQNKELWVSNLKLARRRSTERTIPVSYVVKDTLVPLLLKQRQEHRKHEISRSVGTWRSRRTRPDLVLDESPLKPCHYRV